MKQYQMHPNITKRTKILGWGPMVWIRWVPSEKYRREFKAWTFALIVPIRQIFEWVSCSNETVPNAPKHYETQQNLSLDSFVWIGCVRSKKFWCHFVAWTFALIAPVRPVMKRVSCSNETVSNAPKHYKTHKNISLGSNGVDRVRS